MRHFLIALIGLLVAFGYAGIAHTRTGSWHIVQALSLGVLTMLMAAGFRRYAIVEPRDDDTADPPQPRAPGDTKKGDSPAAPSTPHDRACRSTTAVPSTPAFAPATAAPSTPAFAPAPTPAQQPAPLPLAPTPPLADETPQMLWDEARTMVHNVVPTWDTDHDYLALVHDAAEGGLVEALAKLGDYAYRRGTLVEAYFWTRLARRRLELDQPDDASGLGEIDRMLLNIRRDWTLAGSPRESSNESKTFPYERGELGYAFLRMDIGREKAQMANVIRALAAKGNPDAALFIDPPKGEAVS